MSAAQAHRSIFVEWSGGVKILRLILFVAGMSLLGAGPSVADGVGSQLYEVVTDTGMPHLEENLRYARTLETRCLDRRDLSSAFWMLNDVSLQDCKLSKTIGSPEEDVYRLSCTGGHGTTGQATWQIGPDRLAGTLDVRLGGKNMTFYQRITARSLGACG